MYVCMYVCMCIYLVGQTHLYIRGHIHLSIRGHTHEYIRRHTHTYISMWIHIIHTHIHTWTDWQTYIHDTMQYIHRRSLPSQCVKVWSGDGVLGLRDRKQTDCSIHRQVYNVYLHEHRLYFGSQKDAIADLLLISRPVTPPFV